MTFDPDAMVAGAVAATGLEDLGPPSWRPGLEAFCAAADSEAQLNDLGRVAVPGAVHGALVNRLRVVDYAARHPDVRQESVESPLIVVGMFRAGTTLFSNLLDRDPANRALLRWEAGDSVPPPTPADFRQGPRVEAARAAGAMLEQLNPRLAAIHHEEPDGPTECIAVTIADFRSLGWEAITNVPSYSRWLLADDWRSAYDYHRLALQVLQHGGVRGRWTLKSPQHALALEALVATYPDARLVVLHRDPAVLCASAASLVTEMSGCFSSADHRPYIADHWVELLEESAARLEAFRAARPDVPVVDVAYGDLVARPVDTVAAVSAALGQELSPEARAAMDAYTAGHPPGALGVHRYRPEDFGLDPAELRTRFAGYIDRYRVPVG